MKYQNIGSRVINKNPHSGNSNNAFNVNSDGNVNNNNNTNYGAGVRPAAHKCLSFINYGL